MADPALLEGVTAEIVNTPRLGTHLLAGGTEGGAPVLFVHGNTSSSRFFEETLAALPPEAGYWGFAPDLRGFGGSEPKPLDATRGLGEFSDDLYALAVALGLRDRRVHLVGWSVGGMVAMRYTMDRPNIVASLTLVNPMSPYGFGGTRDAFGTPCWPDYAGSGGGTTNPEFVRRLREGDRSEEDPSSPRNVMNAFYFKPPFRAPKEREEVLLSSMLSSKVAEENYPGDTALSRNWPNVAPGKRGMNNAISPKYCDLSGFARIDPKPPVLWIRGADDALVSDASLLDFGYLGKLGVVPGWPGEEVYPPQPMVSQIRTVLEAYTQNGGSCREEVVECCGHSPQVEKPEEFQRALLGFLEERL
jgi:pimeloyl-ACP methyl ester carboxylesterase